MGESDLTSEALRVALREQGDKPVTEPIEVDLYPYAVRVALQREYNAKAERLEVLLKGRNVLITWRVKRLESTADTPDETFEERLRRYDIVTRLQIAGHMAVGGYSISTDLLDDTFVDSLGMIIDGVAREFARLVAEGKARVKEQGNG